MTLGECNIGEFVEIDGRYWIVCKNRNNHMIVATRDNNGQFMRAQAANLTDMRGIVWQDEPIHKIGDCDIGDCVVFSDREYVVLSKSNGQIVVATLQDNRMFWMRVVKSDQPCVRAHKNTPPRKESHQ